MWPLGVSQGMGQFRATLALARETLTAYGEDGISRQAAALAYFALFALAPLLIVLIEVAALLVGGSGHDRQMRDEIVATLARNTGQQSADVVGAIIESTLAQARHGGILAGIISWAIFLLGATGLFGAIQGSLDDIWHVDRPKPPWWSLIRDRLVFFALIVSASFGLLASLAANTWAPVAVGILAHGAPVPRALLVATNFLISLAMPAVFFLALFKFLPHAKVAWKDAIVGGLVAATLFMFGQLGLSWYLSRAGTASAFGAAGSLVVLVLWMYYSAQIFLLGAEFTKVYARGREARSASRSARLRDKPHL